MVDALGIVGTPEICAKKFKEMMNEGATQVVFSSQKPQNSTPFFLRAQLWKGHAAPIRYALLHPSHLLAVSL
jgi:hypothetical protein